MATLENGEAAIISIPHYQREPGHLRWILIVGVQERGLRCMPYTYGCPIYFETAHKLHEIVSTSVEDGTGSKAPLPRSVPRVRIKGFEAG